MNKQKWLGIFVVVLLASGGWFYLMRQDQRKQIEALVSESHQYRQQLLSDYDKRLELIVGWHKALPSKARAAKAAGLEEIASRHKQLSLKLDTQVELDAFELNQNRLNQIISELLTSKEAQTARPKALESVEEHLNRTRHQYVESAFKADDLIRKGNWNVASVPVFKAESLIRRQSALK